MSGIGTRAWAPAVGAVPSPDRLLAQARLSGSVSLQFRAGRTQDGGTFFPAATTSTRLARSGHLQPGDTAVRLPVIVLAGVVRDAASDALVINPGTTPLAHLARGAIGAIADGMTPDGQHPDAATTIRVADLPDLVPIEGEATKRLLAVARDVAAQIPEVVAAAVGVRPLHGARMFTLLVVLARPVDEARLRSFVGIQLAAALSPDDYAGAEIVARLPEEALAIRVK